MKGLDTTTRPVTSALTENIPEKNYIYQSKMLTFLCIPSLHIFIQNDV